MSLLGAIVRTAVNVAKLPVSLPVAIVKDAKDYAIGEPNAPSNVGAVVQEIKDEAEVTP